jgi:hypothetical protein
MNQAYLGFLVFSQVHDPLACLAGQAWREV